VPDAVDRTTVTGYDVDGDGVADVFESSTVTAVDADGGGTISEDEITVEDVVAVDDVLLDDAAG